VELRIYRIRVKVHLDTFQELEFYHFSLGIGAVHISSCVNNSRPQQFLQFDVFIGCTKYIFLLTRLYLLSLLETVELVYCSKVHDCSQKTLVIKLILDL
jgi:hypothetical protein